MAADDREVFRVLGRLEAKTDALHEDIRTHISTDAAFHTGIEERMRGLEEERAKREGGNRPPPASFPPRWIRETLGHAVTKAVALLIAGGGIGAVLRSFLK